MEVSKLNLNQFEEKQKHASQVSSEITVEKSGHEELGGFLQFGHRDESEELEYTSSELKKHVEEAYNKGWEEGKKAGVNETTDTVLNVEKSAEASIANILSSLKSSLSELENHKTTFKRDMSKLAHYAVGRIIDIKVEESFEDILLSAFDKILPLVSTEPKISIIMNEADMELAKAKIEKGFCADNFKAEVEFNVDDSVQKHSCRVEWANNGINFDLDEKIKQIDEIINEYIKSI